MPRSEKNPAKREIFAALGMFALGFVAVAGAIHAAIRNPLRLHADIRSEKLAVLDQMKGKAESAAFGSSHVHNGFDPGAFDRELARSPLQTLSENLAVAGGSQSEQRAMALEFVRHLQPPRDGSHTCLVMLELNAGANFTPDHLVHPRAIDVYDWKTARFISHLVEPGMTFQQRTGRTGFAVVAAGLHYANVGMLSNLIFAPPLDETRIARETEGDRRGQEIDFDSPAREAAITNEIAARPKEVRFEPTATTPGNGELVTEIADASPVRNLAFAYIVMPNIGDLKRSNVYPDHLDAAGMQVPIVDLARPDRYPQLYQADLWHDEAHLNERGAEKASALAADDLKQWYAAHGGAPTCGG